MTLGLDHGDTLAKAVATGLTSAAARPVSFTEDLGDGLSGAQDVDLYKFTASAGDRLAASTGLPTGGVPADTYLRLFNASGGQLAFNNDAGKTGYSSLAYTFTAGGTYYIGVSGYPNSDYNPKTGGGVVAGGTGDYRLVLNLDHGDALATALGTGLTTASPRSFTEDLGDGAWGNKDVDIYKFTASAGDTLTAATALPTGGKAMDTYLRLFDASGVQLAANDNATGKYSRIDYTFAAAGTYYIGVSGYANSTYDPKASGSGKVGSTGDYSLTLTLAGSVWNVATDFSPTNNPNKAWSYGYSNTLAGTFNLLTNTGQITSAAGLPIDFWFPTGGEVGFGGAQSFHNGNATPQTWRNLALDAGQYEVAPDEAPYVVTRWIAPASGHYQVNALFEGMQFTVGNTVDVHVFKNNVSLFDSNVIGWAGRPYIDVPRFGSSPEQSYNAVLTVVAGDTLDFVVGNGGNGGHDDATGLAITIQRQNSASAANLIVEARPDLKTGFEKTDYGDNRASDQVRGFPRLSPQSQSAVASIRLAGTNNMGQAAAEATVDMSRKTAAIVGRIVARAADESKNVLDGLLGALIPDDTDLSNLTTAVARSKRGHALARGQA